MDMMRLETFTDAAFAFAVTLLVISVDDVPGSYVEFIDTLKLIPAFIACFATLMLFWWGHHVWSRCYGLEDGWSMIWSLVLVACVLIYIYPLQVIFGAFFSDASSGVLPQPFELDASQIGTLFVIYGAGWTTLSGCLMVLFLVALQHGGALALNARELFETRVYAIGWGLGMLTGIGSGTLAALLPAELSALSGHFYWTLMVSIPLLGLWVSRKRRALLD
ncbi:MAG: TMEM175 family protein [Gemmatimonadetes bacterium]|nr:TMEM175 family protein [Gemmatimonadota bacterium]